MKTPLVLSFALTLGMAIASCGQQSQKSTAANSPSPMQTTKSEGISSSNTEIATFGSGCFWCTEAIFQRLEGVISVASGYSGGKVKNPTYREVCSGLTGHAEVIQISYDPQLITFEELLEVFWKTHDPTTLNRQGADEGTQYRSVVFYHSEAQRALATEYKAKLDESGAFNDPIVTEISPYTEFYKAEDYHQNYYNLNGKAPYCSYVIEPKVEKFEKVFAKKLKKNTP